MNAIAIAVLAASVADLTGSWLAELRHEGESTPFGLELEAAEDGKVLVKMSMPVVHMRHQAVGKMPLSVSGQEVKFGPFAFTYDPAARTLSGAMPKDLVPVYSIPLLLKRVDRLDLPERPEVAAPLAEPIWTFEAGSPLWPGATFADGTVYAGGNDGRLHALDAATGKPRWSFLAGGPIRALATVAGGDVFFQADDGFVYKLAAATGKEQWRVQVGTKPVERLPFDNPKSRYDRFGSGVTVDGGRLYLGTHEGRVLALEAASGKTVWEFASGDSVLAAPAVALGRVYFGSYDGHVYALDAVRGQLVWKHDTKAAVVSTPAVDAASGRVVIGSRSYDLLGLDAATGARVWKQYIWSSWVESSASLRDGVAYVGSSDAAALYAFDARTGRRLWATDVHGWAWGQPAVTEGRVFIGAAATKDYLVGHRGGAVAVDRATGRPVWNFVAKASDAGSYGFPGTPALGAGRVFLTGLDGRVYAFAQ
ncbi:MAG TPA: PQQ-binding-like beta-propeller repeat protein [Vicinamibacteria bacterium]